MLILTVLRCYVDRVGFYLQLKRLNRRESVHEISDKGWVSFPQAQAFHIFFLLAQNLCKYFCGRHSYNITTPLSCNSTVYYFICSHTTLSLSYYPLTYMHHLGVIPRSPNITLPSSQPVLPPKPWDFQREALVKQRFLGSAET